MLNLKSWFSMAVVSGLALCGLAACGDADATAGSGGDGSGGENGGGTSAQGAGGDGGVGGSPELPAAVDCTHVGSGTDYRVGPGQDYENINDVPFETLVGGDTVRIFWREGAYHEKLMIGGQGSADQPIRVCGVPGPEGQLPVIDAKDATSRPEVEFPFEGHQVRGGIVMGHRYSDPYEQTPGPFVLEGLAITGADEGNSFTDVTGATQAYAAFAAGVFVQRGTGIVIRGCEVYGNANGLFIGSTGGDDATRDVLIESNYIHDNGSLTAEFVHNVYNEAIGVTYQFNYLGSPRKGENGVRGNNIKERSAGVVIRYNWIEDGAHLIDLVDAQEAQQTTVPLPEFHESFVYGNVLMRNGVNSAMVHYGGDSGIFDTYRKGTLHAFNNTFVVVNDGQTNYTAQAFYELSTNEEALSSRNNVYYATQTPGELSPIILLGERDTITQGHADSSHDWIGPGLTAWRNPVDWPTNFNGEVVGFEAQAAGSVPDFVDMETLHPMASSKLVGAGLSSAELPATVELQYAPFARAIARTDGGPLTQGAFSAD